MLPNLRAYHRPTTLDEAVRLIRPPAVVPLGGGTVLLPARDPAVEEVVDLSGLGLTCIRAGGTESASAPRRPSSICWNPPRWPT